MTDEELLDLNRRGFIPGPHENEEDFLYRVKETGKEAVKLSGTAIPKTHWEWVRRHLSEVFDFEPESLPAFYSNRLLAPWQGAAAWIMNGKLIGIQLRESLKNGSYFFFYERNEILAHEAVHAARCAFAEKENEEFFAYLTSSAKWRRALGPIVRRPWESWPFLICAGMGIFIPLAFVAGSLWVTLGFLRLLKQHKILKKAASHILKETKDMRKTRAILLRLTDAEIRGVAKSANLKQYEDESLRWRLLRLAYLR